MERDLLVPVHIHLRACAVGQSAARAPAVRLRRPGCPWCWPLVRDPAGAARTSLNIAFAVNVLNDLKNVSASARISLPSLFRSINSNILTTFVLTL